MLFVMAQKKKKKKKKKLASKVVKKKEGNQFVTSHAKMYSPLVITFGDFIFFPPTFYVPSREQSVHPQSY